ncbi:BAG family molecular chaperone regulator 1 [Glycine soja]
MERDSKVFLDIVGVKDKSKLMFVEDSISQEKRYLEMRMNAKMERTTKYISEISLEVDRLAGQVSALESILSKGGKVSEMNVLNLIDLLINQLLKLDSIMVDEDVKMKREMQDMLKIKNSMASTNEDYAPRKPQHKHSNRKRLAPIQEQPQSVSNGHHKLAPNQEQQQHKSLRHSTSKVVVTTKWETFDLYHHYFRTLPPHPHLAQ